MDIRFFGRVTALALLVFAFASVILGGFFNKTIGNAPWYALGAAFVVALLLFQGWGRVGAVLGRGVKRAAPHVQAGGAAVGHAARSNVAAILAAITTFGGRGTTFRLAGKGFQKVMSFLGKLLFGGYGRDALCFGWMIVSLLVAVALPVFAFPAMTAAIGFFIGAVMLGVNDRAIKKK